MIRLGEGVVLVFVEAWDLELSGKPLENRAWLLYINGIFAPHSSRDNDVVTLAPCWLRCDLHSENGGPIGRMDSNRPGRQDPPS